MIKRTLKYGLPILVIGGFLTLCSSGDKSSPVIDTPQGPLQGTISKAGIANFKGIPYAAPPVGDLRWRAPEAPITWTDTRQATEFSPICMQPLDGTEEGIFDIIINGLGLSKVKKFLIGRVVASMPKPETSEDCLYLNVRTPALDASGESTNALPVMVWIHGGNHQFGSADFSYYQGDTLPSKGVVLVTINYRLGALGYLAHPALSADDPNGVSGNYGTQDQIAALTWVRDNIASYGGDPKNVTIFGESAGAWSVTEMMASPMAEGLFHKAIGQSGASTYHLGQMAENKLGWISGHETGRLLDEALGLDTPDAQTLRNLPADKIVNAVTPAITEGLHHVQDGHVFPKGVGLALSSGKYNAVPSMFGYNAHESTLFYPSDPQPSVWGEGFPEGGTRAEQIKALSIAYPAQAETLVDLYSLDNADENTRYQGGMDMQGDEIFGVNVRLTARINEAKNMPSYLYSFNRVGPSEKQTVGAFHSAELPFVFDTHEKIMGYSKEDEALTEQMTSYWTNFAKTGNPNGEGLPNWPAHQGENWMMLEANTGEQTRAVKAHRKDKLDALEEGLVKKLRDLEASQTPAE
ncbi:MAG: carboxylesterase/lipase family protein [Maricaulaceae bacterium]